MASKKPLLVESGSLKEFGAADNLFAEGGFLNGTSQHKFSTSAFYPSVIGGAATAEYFLIGSIGTLNTPDVVSLKGLVEIYVSGSPIYIYKIEYTATLRTDATGEATYTLQQNKTTAKSTAMSFDLSIYKDSTDGTYKVVCGRIGSNPDAIFSVAHQHDIKRRYSTGILWENAPNASKITIPAEWQQVLVNSRGIDRLLLADRLLVGATEANFGGDEPFQVNGVIKSASGGFKFPDGTVQTTAASGGSSSISITERVATAGQTVFTVSYNVSNYRVYQNGVMLASGDYTGNGSQVTLAVGAAAGDIIAVESIASVTASSFAYTSMSINTTASENSRFVVDTSASALTLTLPATPSTGCFVMVTDAEGTFATNNLTVARNGNTIMGLAEDLICDLSMASFTLTYIGNTWRIA